MPAKKKKQRHIRPKGASAKADEGSGDEADAPTENAEPAPQGAALSVLSCRSLTLPQAEAAASESPECPHLNSVRPSPSSRPPLSAAQANPERIKEVLKAGNALWCTDCLMSRPAEKGGKKKKSAVPRKKKQQATPPLDPDDVWICLTCGNPGAPRSRRRRAIDGLM